MENISKALIIAGGVLLGIIIVSIFMVMFTRMSNMQLEQDEMIKVEQLAAFNAEYEAYNKKVMYGVDVITLINKAKRNNEKYNGNSNYKITITLDGVEMSNSSSLIEEDKEKYIYKCTGMEYNNLGRICKIKIVTAQVVN